MFLSSKLHLDVLREHKQQALDSGQPVVLNPNKIHEEFKTRLGLNGRATGILAGVYGVMWFVYVPVLFIGGWMALQAWRGQQTWDLYPFLLLLIIGNLIQLLGGPIIQVGLNFASVHAELRAEAAYEVHKKSFADIEMMQGQLEKLETENRELLRWIKENAVIHVSEEAQTLKAPAPILPLEAFSAPPTPVLPPETPGAE